MNSVLFDIFYSLYASPLCRTHKWLRQSSYGRRQLQYRRLVATTATFERRTVRSDPCVSRMCCNRTDAEPKRNQSAAPGFSSFCPALSLPFSTYEVFRQPPLSLSLGPSRSLARLAVHNKQFFRFRAIADAESKADRMGCSRRPIFVRRKTERERFAHVSPSVNSPRQCFRHEKENGFPHQPRKHLLFAFTEFQIILWPETA